MRRALLKSGRSYSNRNDIRRREVVCGTNGQAIDQIAAGIDMPSKRGTGCGRLRRPVHVSSKLTRSTGSPLYMCCHLYASKLTPLCAHPEAGFGHSQEHCVDLLHLVGRGQDKYCRP